MSKFIIASQQATGAEIHEITERIGEVLEGVPRAHAIIALLSLATFYQNPELSADELIEAVRQVSRYMAMVVTGVGEEGKRPN